MMSNTNHSAPETARRPDHFLAEWRVYRGFDSQREFAKAIGVSNSKISRIETGESELRPRFASKCARFFAIPLAAVFSINPLGEGREDAELLDAINDIAPEDKAVALRMLRSLRRTPERTETG